MDPDAGGGVGPLVLEVLGRRDHGDLTDEAAVEEFGGHLQGVVVLPAPGVATVRKSFTGRAALQVCRERALLPARAAWERYPRLPAPGRRVRGDGRREVLAEPRHLARSRAFADPAPGVPPDQTVEGTNTREIRVLRPRVGPLDWRGGGA